MSRNEIEIVNPRTGQKIASYSPHDSAAVEVKLQRAVNAQKQWAEKSISVRAALLLKIETALLRERDSLAALIADEMGKSMAEARAEIEKCAACARFYSESGPRFLAHVEVPTEARRSYVAFAPLGVVMAIMPWNFPFWQAFRCALPAILAGNTVVLKHASNVSGCALAMEKIWESASGDSLPLFQAILVPGSGALDIIRRKEIAAVSFTGSTSVGKEIAGVAGANLKKCVLELGGSDPYIVLADADLDLAAELCAKSRLINAGQSCISAKRFIVEKTVLAEFEKKFVANLARAPLAPLAREDLRLDLHAQVLKSVEQGARLLLGGEIPVGDGFHYPATVLGGVRPGMTAFDEELFGPVAAVIEAANEEDAIRLANQSAFGLGSAVFTRDLARGERIARDRMTTGSCFVNELVRSDPRLPFGGVKDSGYGRELADFGIREFTNIKTVYVS